MFALAELPEQLCFTVRVFFSSLFELEALCITVSSWLAYYEYSILSALYSLESHVNMHVDKAELFLCSTLTIQKGFVLWLQRRLETDFIYFNQPY